MAKIKTNTYITHKKNFDWSDTRNFLVNYSMLKVYVRYGMVVDKVHEITSIKQSKWLEKHRGFSTEKRSRTKSQFGKDFFNFQKNSFYGKTMESVRNTVKIDFIETDDNGKIMKQQTKLTIDGIHKSHENYNS